MSKFIIGVTGQAGSGKTFAIDNLKNKIDFEYIDLDRIGHSLLNQKEIKEKLIATFNENITTNYHIDRKKLGEVVFSNQINLNKLNDIMHPSIKKQTLLQIKNSPKKIIIIVGALISEINLISVCHKIISITASKKDQFANLGIKKRVIKYQEKEKYYERIADKVIVNTFNKEFIDKFTDLVQNLVLEK